MCRAPIKPSSVEAMHAVSAQGDWVQAVWLSPFPYQMFGTIVGFIVVFRCAARRPFCQIPVQSRHLDTLWHLFHCRAQWAHERYIAGRDGCQTMTARWADACAQVGALLSACILQ